MSQTLSENLPLILIVLAAAAMLAFFFLRPRQKVRLTDSGPARAHMAHSFDLSKDAITTRGEGQGLGAEAAAATSDIAGAMLQADTHGHLPGATGTPDDLTRLKGVGPKLAALLVDKGLVRFDQLSSLSPGQVETLDASLGAFKGRLARDRVIEQADYLARGDLDGYQLKFGKL